MILCSSKPLKKKIEMKSKQMDRDIFRCINKLRMLICAVVIIVIPIIIFSLLVQISQNEKIIKSL